MDEEAVVAAPSAAVEPAFTQFDGWDEEGTPVVTKKAEAPQPEKADSATAGKAEGSKEETTEDGSEAESGKKPAQETRRKPDAEARIRELAAETKRLKAELEEARKPKEETKADSSPARAAETKPAAPPPTRPKPTMQDKGADGKPKYPSYEEFNEDLVDWGVEQRFAKQQREQQQTQALEKVKQQAAETAERYPDYWEKAAPLVKGLNAPDVPKVVSDALSASPVLTDLLYVLAGSAKTSAEFLETCRTDPGKALRLALLMEQDIVAELGKGKGAAKASGEGETEATPATPKPRAPKPPTEVGGRGAPGEDALLAAAKSNDFRAFEAEQTKRALASRK